MVPVTGFVGALLFRFFGLLGFFRSFGLFGPFGSFGILFLFHAVSFFIAVPLPVCPDQSVLGHDIFHVVRPGIAVDAPVVVLLPIPAPVVVVMIIPVDMTIV